jgi:multiple sugar transport system substrate-binding protein
MNSPIGTSRAVGCVAGGVIAAIAVVLLFPGCGREKKQEQAVPTITFWHSFVATTVPALDDLLAEFRREHPGIQVNAQYLPTGDGLIQKLVSAMQSGTTPDIAWVHSDFLDKLVEAGAIYPMREFTEGVQGLSPDEMNDFFAPLLEACTVRDTLFALPMEATSLALFYNRDLLEEAGLDPNRPPATWAELEAAARRLTRDRDSDGRTDVYGFFIPVFPSSGELNIWMNLQWMPFLWQAGGTEMTPDRKRVLWNSEPGAQALSLWKRLYDTMDFRTFGIQHDIGFASGRLAMIMDGPWDLPRFRKLPSTRWSVAPLPAGPAGSATYIAGEQLVIFRQSKLPREAWTFLRWVTEPRIQARFSKSSGYLPVRRSVLDMKEYQEFLKTDEPMRVFVDQMRVGRARMMVDRHWVEINRMLAEAIEKATLGRGDPKACLDEAVARANERLAGK